MLYECRGYASARMDVSPLRIRLDKREIPLDVWSCLARPPHTLSCETMVNEGFKIGGRYG